jgi:hypothetical protein
MEKCRIRGASAARSRQGGANDVSVRVQSGQVREGRSGRERDPQPVIAATRHRTNFGKARDRSQRTLGLGQHVVFAHGRVFGRLDQALMDGFVVDARALKPLQDADDCDRQQGYRDVEE